MKDYTKNSKAKPIVDTRGRVIGRIDGDILSKHARASRHLLRNPLGWCWDKVVLEQAKREGVYLVTIFDDESGMVYVVFLSNFLGFGIPIDRGFGEQLCLPLKYWDVLSPEE